MDLVLSIRLCELDSEDGGMHAACRIVLSKEPALSPSDYDQLHEMFFRLGTATFLGGCLGVDRDLHRKPAGIRVLALVSMGAAAISMVSAIAVSGEKGPLNDGVLRTIQGVLSGIGFLGAGVIMRAQGRDEVHGIVTAASIWVSAILGMICGIGNWQLALCTFLLAWTVLVCGRTIEKKVMQFAPPLSPEPPTNGVDSSDKTAS